MAVSLQQEALRVRAQAKHVRFSARKARFVLDQVRGRPYAKAEATLMFSPRAASVEILSVLRSAAANARENNRIPADELVIETAYADEDRTLNRMQPRARGRAGKIRKRSCHITLVLRHVPGEASAAVAETAAKASAAAVTIEKETKRRAPAKPKAGAAEATVAVAEKPKRAPRAKKTDAPTGEKKTLAAAKKKAADKSEETS